jgi:hypothetical protein
MEPPKIQHKDIFGNPINVGDYIVYSAVDNRSGVLRAAKVVQLKARTSEWDKDKAPEPTVLVVAAENYWDEGPRPLSKKITLGFMNRIVVVQKSSMSQDWIDAINLTGKFAP